MDEDRRCRTMHEGEGQEEDLPTEYLRVHTEIRDAFIYIGSIVSYIAMYVDRTRFFLLRAGAGARGPYVPPDAMVRYLRYLRDSRTFAAGYRGRRRYRSLPYMPATWVLQGPTAYAQQINPAALR